MKILVYLHFFYPETGAGSIRLQQFVKVLTSGSHEVLVISPTPNYPSKELYSDFKKSELIFYGAKVKYLPIYIAKNDSLINRAFSYFSYFFSSSIYALFFTKNIDLIISSSPPIITSFAAVMISKLKSARFIWDVRDIWPDIGIELGILNNTASIKFLKWIEKKTLEYSSAIMVTTLGDKNNILSKISNKKVEIIYNGADSDLFVPKTQQEKNIIRKKYDLPENKIILVYFGSFNFGMNDIEILGNTLEQLTSEKDNFHFIAIGEGNLKNDLINKIDGKICYSSFSSLPSNIVSELISVCDLTVIPRKKIKCDTGGNVPVKCYESLAAGTPFILSVNVNDESSKIFANKEFAKLIPTGDAGLLKDSILIMIAQNNLSKLGLAGREFIKINFDRKKQSEKLIEIIKNLYE